MEILKFVKIEQNSRLRLQRNECRLHYKTGKESNYSLTFNYHVANQIKEKNFMYVRFAENTITGETFMVFQADKADESLRVRLYNGRNNFFASLNGKAVMEYIIRRLELDKDTCDNNIINISENVSRNDDALTYIISK